MPSTASSLLKIEKQAAGENSNTWGTKANVVFEGLEAGIAGRTAVTLSADVTLTDTQYVANESRAMILDVTGAGGFNIVIPNRSKAYLVRNASSGIATITTGSGTTVAIAAGSVEWVFCVGSNTIYRMAIPATALSGTAASFRTLAGLGTISTEDEATAAQIRANTASKAMATDKAWSAVDTVALTDAATIAVDMSTFLNASVTLGGNRTLGNPSNTKNGQSGLIYITQDGTGSRTLAYASNWKFSRGTAPTLTTTAGAIDVISYQVKSSTFIMAQLIRDVK